MMFRLFMGSFETIINDPDCGSVMLLKLKLEHFYSRVRKHSSILYRNMFDIVYVNTVRNSTNGPDTFILTVCVFLLSISVPALVKVK